MIIFPLATSTALFSPAEVELTGFSTRTISGCFFDSSLAIDAVLSLLGARAMIISLR
jgi:hypothetical protein